MSRRTMVSTLVAAGFLAVVALGQPPGASNDPSQPATKKPAPGRRAVPGRPTRPMPP